MAHYKVINRSLASMASEYTHDPEDYTASLADYLEAEHALGWKLLSLGEPSGFWLVFEAIAQS